MADPRDINLLPFEEREQERFALIVKRLSLAAVISLVLTALFTLITLIFFTRLASRRSELISDVERSSSTINTYKATEELVVVVKNKVASADKILSLRANYPGLFDALAQLVPQGVYFTDFKVSSGKIIITGKAKTSADVAGFVSSLLSPAGNQLVSRVSVDTLNSDDQGIYSFSLSGQLKTK